MVDIEITLQPKQKEALKASFTTPVLFYGGAKGGGKSYLVRAREVYRRLKYPLTSGLIIRKTYPELLSNHIRKFFLEYPVVKHWYNKSEKTIYWPNGSITEFSYLKNSDDVYTYQGREYEDISIDEITQHEEEVYKTLRTSNRTSNMKFKEEGGIATMMLTGNPGGIGHFWVKRIFIDRMFSPKEKPDDHKFIQAFVQDNQAMLEADPEYIDRLRDLPDYLVKAYLEGDWNIFAGQAFVELSRHVHIVEPFNLPPLTQYFGGYDYGFDHPFAFVLLAMTPDEKIYVVSYLKKRNIEPYEQARMISELLQGKKITIYSSPDVWARRGLKIVEELRRGLPDCSWVQANDDRKQGVAAIRKLIAYKHRENPEPQLYFFKNTEEVYTNLAEMVYDIKKPEDVIKSDASSTTGKGGDDLYDAIRYGLNSRVNPREKAESIKPNSWQETIEWIKKKEALHTKSFDY